MKKKFILLIPLVIISCIRLTFKYRANFTLINKNNYKTVDYDKYEKGEHIKYDFCSYVLLSPYNRNIFKWINQVYNYDIDYYVLKSIEKANKEGKEGDYLTNIKIKYKTNSIMLFIIIMCTIVEGDLLVLKGTAL
jgi:hypothetical protein